MCDTAHLAELIATIGPPPLEFLQRNRKRAAGFWDEHGTFGVAGLLRPTPTQLSADHWFPGSWLGHAAIPSNRTLGELEARLEDSTRFIAFLRRVLTWVPEKRPTARKLLEDPWLATRNRQ
jgi:hypothetical protein